MKRFSNFLSRGTVIELFFYVLVMLSLIGIMFSIFRKVRSLCEKYSQELTLNYFLNELYQIKEVIKESYYFRTKINLEFYVWRDMVCYKDACRYVRENLQGIGAGYLEYKNGTITFS